MQVINNLVGSRRFWLAVVTVFVTILSTGVEIKPEVVSAIQQFALALIAAFTIEDSATALKG